ncbi:hypothetical protein JCM10207_009101 [Rhodosporidiobolus poonsookiae]
MSHYQRQHHNPHHRPQPLALHPQGYNSYPSHAQGSLRSAPLPAHHTGHVAYAPQAPLTAAYNQFQADQIAYLQAMEGQMLAIQQAQAQLLQAQQIEAQKTMLAMQRAAVNNGYTAPAPAYGSQQAGQYRPQEQAQPHNPLVASALARRAKRASLNLSNGQQPHEPAEPAASYGHQSPSPQLRTPQLARERRSFSPSSQSPHHSGRSSPASSRASPAPGGRNAQNGIGNKGAARRSPPPPAVILSAPGEPYPDTSSSGSSSQSDSDGGSESGETRPSSPEVRESGSSTAAEPQGHGPSQVKKERRRSHLDSLAILGAAANERRRRPVSASYGGLGGLGGPEGSPRQPGGLRNYQQAQAQAQAHPRSVSDSHAPLSPCASAFSPPLASPPTATSARPAPPAVPGTASATRQPRGPPSDVLAGGANFAQRVRAHAVGTLAGKLKARTGGVA